MKENTNNSKKQKVIKNEMTKWPVECNGGYKKYAGDPKLPAFSLFVYSFAFCGCKQLRLQVVILGKGVG